MIDDSGGLEEMEHKTLIGHYVNIWGFVQEHSTDCLISINHLSILPKEFCPRRTELQDSANQTLSLIKRWRGTGKVEFAV